MFQDYGKRMRPNSGSNRKGKTGKSKASMTLKDLVDVGVILPGRNKISVSYKGVNYVASLGKDGIIVYQGKALQSQSAAMHLSIALLAAQNCVSSRTWLQQEQHA